MGKLVQIRVKLLLRLPNGWLSPMMLRRGSLPGITIFSEQDGVCYKMAAEPVRTSNGQDY